MNVCFENENALIFGKITNAAELIPTDEDTSEGLFEL